MFLNKIIYLKWNILILIYIIKYKFRKFVVYYIKKLLSSKLIDIGKNKNNFISKCKYILDNEEFSENEIMKLHTAFNLGGPVKYYIKPKSINNFTIIQRIFNSIFYLG